MKKLLGSSYDMVVREFFLAGKEELNCAVLYLKGMTNTDTINDHIIKPLINGDIPDSSQESQSNILHSLKTKILPIGEIKQTTWLDEIVTQYIAGDTVLFLDGCDQAMLLGTADWETRSIAEPQTETVVRGSREGFTENLLTNTTLLRRKIKSNNLILDTMVIGKQSKTLVCIAYIKEIANPLLIEEIKRRLSLIRIDAVLESGYIEQFIEDAPTSIFSTVGNSEKPDVVAAKILEGRTAILVDGTPFVLTVPMLFLESFQSAEDYYSRPYYASIVRMIRFLAYAVSVLAPGTYVLLVTFHQELIPTSLLFTIASQEEGVPFPTFLEVLFMGAIFEVLREAGIRLPRPVGQAISIVGALVIGESAVRSGLIGEPVIIVVAFTAVASFVVPPQTDSATILRLFFLLLAGSMGIYGLLIGLIAVYLHLCSLRSFGVPYLSPLAPLSPRDLKDSFVRMPLWTMLSRPRLLSSPDPQRQEFRLDYPASSSKPSPQKSQKPFRVKKS